jgi:phospholipase/lecithinase/hemolysin
MIRRFSLPIRLAVIVAAHFQISSLFASYSGLVAFGDSLTDQGNTISYFMPPTFEGQTGYDTNYYNAAYNSYGVVAEGRWSSGATWIEYFHAKLLSGGSATAPVALGKNFGVGTLESDYGSGTNFAYGGSTTSTGYTDLILSNLQQQISDFVSLTGTEGSKLHNYDIDGALFSVWSGGNDAIYWVEAGDFSDVEGVTATSTSNIHAAVTALYDAGARHFLMINLPDLGKKPNYIGTEDGEMATAFVNSFNSKLADVVLDLQTNLEDVSITFFDAHAKFNLLLENPEAFGFTDDTTPAYVFLGSDHDPTSTIVADPTKHVFWDNTHPTTQVHELLGNFAYEALIIPEPASVGLVVVAGFLALFRRRSASRLS